MGAKQLPFISIIVPTKDGEKIIGRCLKSLVALDYPKNKYEIVVPDGLSTDKTREIAQSYGAKVVINKKQATTPGRNVGFEASRGDLVAFSDHDCVMDKGWLSNSVKYFESKDVGGVGGPTLTPEEERSFAKTVSFIFKLAVILGKSVHSENVKQIKEVKDLPGCNTIYRRTVLERVMPIDENLLVSDLERNFRIRELGYKLLSVPDVIVWHYRRATPKGFWKQIYGYAIARLQVGKKSYKMISFIHILVGMSIPLLLVISVISYLANPYFFYLFTGLILAAFLGIFFFALIQSKSPRTSGNVLLATAIFIFSWSCGFLRELIFPMRDIKRK